MSVSRVRKVIEQVKKFTAEEKRELLRSLLAEGVLNDDYFSEEEALEIEAALQEVARGEWVDFDEFRKTQNI